jgi:hypothetical protein
MNMTVDAAMAASMTDSRCWPNGTLGGILYEGREQFDDRHTHRGPFAPDPLPARLLAGLQHDALAEGATLALVDRLWPTGSWRTSSARLAAGKIWTHWPRRRCGGGAGTRMIPLATAFPRARFPPRPTGKPGGSPQRDFDLGRGLGLLDADGPPPAAAAVLLTPGDGRADWLRAGQALHRLLAHAASMWVFASLHSQPLEAAAVRALIKNRLALPGAPQMLLQLGVALRLKPPPVGRQLTSPSPEIGSCRSHGAAGLARLRTGAATARGRTGKSSPAAYGDRRRHGLSWPLTWPFPE